MHRVGVRGRSGSGRSLKFSHNICIRDFAKLTSGSSAWGKCVSHTKDRGAAKRTAAGAALDIFFRKERDWQVPEGYQHLSSSTSLVLHVIVEVPGVQHCA